ncbi:hypothetical protein I79_006222 [Cricetulus griseus]|uniref:Uncharacterized protein n=1 Tax=Cricetulus griseus TaxID=10029 RepID=G3H793_CRIGR|nr:hypothetical protein I79_006222 [Cricetulus griseus]
MPGKHSTTKPHSGLYPVYNTTQLITTLLGRLTVCEMRWEPNNTYPSLLGGRQDKAAG